MVRERRNIKLANLFFLIFICFVGIALSGCGAESYENVVFYNDIEYSTYANALATALPSFSPTHGINSVFDYLSKGAVVEAFEPQAVSALQVGAAKYWYPHYLATVIIAIDRDKTSVSVSGWRDLIAANETVGLCSRGIDYEMLTATISFGLEGEDFTNNDMIELLAQLQRSGLLRQNTFETSIIICYDYQAAMLVKNGRNIEIVVPQEGTLSYAKGLLSNKELVFPNEFQSILVNAGFRTLDASCDANIYPSLIAYERAKQLESYAHYNTVSLDSFRLFRRNVMQSRRYSSADGREHQLFALIYILVVSAWTFTFIRRAMQVGIRSAAFVICVVLIGWITVRLIKYQIPDGTTPDRYLWFSYYIFQLSLPIVVLWLAWLIDKPTIYVPPNWLKALIGIYVLLIAFVMTNDFHQLVFQIDLTNPYWTTDYAYGAGYKLILAATFLPLLPALWIMIKKGKSGLRNKGLFFLMGLILLLTAYTYGYINRIPIAWESDFTMTTGVFVLLMMETMIRIGMIPVNSKSKEMFSSSTLGMEIFDKSGQKVWSSAFAMEFGKELLTPALSSYPLPIHPDEDSLLFAAEITGGSVLWREDISELNLLHKEIEDSVKKLEASNAILSEEEQLFREIEAQSSKTALMDQLETEIAQHTQKLSAMMEQLDTAPKRDKEMAQITMLLCYIKRRCSLFFMERETETIGINELDVYFNEMIEIAQYAGINIISTSFFDTELTIRLGTLMYDFFFNIIFWASRLDNMSIISTILSESSSLVLRLLMSDEGLEFQMDETLDRAIGLVGGIFVLKSIDEDTVSLSLSFPI
ncbi:MAG: hypothetical protein FWG88_02690 [Oscillospiraceae bacterium]|nr:hypothetical protein [Oscillospiraceae bacterium]